MKKSLVITIGISTAILIALIVIINLFKSSRLPSDSLPVPTQIPPSNRNGNSILPTLTQSQRDALLQQQSRPASLPASSSGGFDK